MQEPSVFIGIDISKATLDICVLQAEQRQHYVIQNDPQAIHGFFQQAAFAAPSMWE